MSEPEDQIDDCYVICPHCEYNYQAEAEDYSENEREETCNKCGKVFLLRDEMTITHYTKPTLRHRMRLSDEA